MILVMGGDGNMGRRYRSILAYLGKTSASVDIHTPTDEVVALSKRAEGVIIATPTRTHCTLIRGFSDMGIPILCEKPFTKNLDELESTLDICGKNKTKIDMVYQYKILCKSQRPDWTYYNYFKHGTDGLEWDCIQIIGLAKGPISLEEESPMWRCRVNGTSLDIAHMDAAYVHFIRQWMRYPGQSIKEISDIHHKTAEIAGGPHLGPIA